jgi:hypothetical protein
MPAKSKTKKLRALDAQSEEVFEVLHKVTIEDEVLDRKGDAARLVKDLRLGANDMIWISGRLSDLSEGHGGRAIFPSEVEDCDTAGDLVAVYRTAIANPPHGNA